MALTSAELTIGNQALSMIGQKIIDSTDTSNADTGTGGHPYEKLELVFDQTRDSLQRLYEWNFARARLALVDDWAAGTDYTTDMYVWEDSVLYKCDTAHRSTTWNDHYIYDGDDLLYSTDDLVFDEDYLIVDDQNDFHWTMVLDRPETYWTYRYSLPANFKRFCNMWLKENETRHKVEQGYILCDETELDINYVKQVTDPSEFDDLYTEILIYSLAIKLTFSLMGSGYSTQALRRDLNNEKADALSRAKAVNSIESEQGRRKSYEWVNARYGDGKI